MWFGLLWACWAVAWAWLLLRGLVKRKPVQHGCGKRVEPAVLRSRKNKKPEWVVRQLVLLQAHMPTAGCRSIAATFNRVFAHRDVSVSKSFVYRALRERAHAVALARKAIRQAKPRSVAINRCWSVDMTGRADTHGDVHMILGIVDHGSRLAVRLARIPHKCAWTLLGHLCLAVAQFGKPRAIRTDNESCFTAKVFSTGLRWLGIAHQRSDLHCPWMNGRIERLFGTLKSVLRRWEFDGCDALRASLIPFTTWYNEIRPHQSLGGMTPQEAWQGVNPFHAPQPPREVQFVEGWDGLLAGFRIRR